MAINYGIPNSKINSKSGQYFLIGRVKNIVLGPYLDDSGTPNPEFSSFADVGKINFEILYSSDNISKSDQMTKSAYPIFSFIKQYPIINEIVLIITGPSAALNDDFNNQNLYYFPPYSLWNSINHNAFPNLEEYYEFLANFEQKPGYQGTTDSNLIELPKGYTFTENEKVKNLTPFEGDSILEGRFGQSIRFGSTTTNSKTLNNWSNSGTNGDPIIIIRNGQGRDVDSLDKFSTIIENINTDASSIYLTNGQEIILEDINNFPKQSYGITVNNLQQPIIQVLKKPISNDSIDAQTQDTNSIS